MMPTNPFRFPRLLVGAVIIMAIASMLCNAAPAKDAVLDAPMRTFSTSHELYLWTLCRQMQQPCGVEEGRFDDLAISSSMPPLLLTKTSSRQVLDAIVERYPDYRWVVRDGVINLEPKAQHGEDLLARVIAAQSFRGVSSYKAALDVLHEAEISAGYQLQGRGRYGVINIDLEEMTVREALNAIAKADGKVMWFLTTGTAGISLSMPSWRKVGASFSLDERKNLKWPRRKRRPE